MDSKIKIYIVLAFLLLVLPLVSAIPNVTIFFPANNTWYDFRPENITYNITEDNPDMCWYDYWSTDNATKTDGTWTGYVGHYHEVTNETFYGQYFRQTTASYLDRIRIDWYSGSGSCNLYLDLYRFNVTSHEPYGNPLASVIINNSDLPALENITMPSVYLEGGQTPYLLFFSFKDDGCTRRIVRHGNIADGVIIQYNVLTDTWTQRTGDFTYEIYTTPSPYQKNVTVSCNDSNNTLRYVYGFDNITLYANDTSGNQSSVTSYFNVDALDPYIDIVYPNNITYDTVPPTPTTLNFTYEEDNPNTCWYNINGTNITLGSCTNVTGLNASEGSHTWWYYMNDTVGNEYGDSITFEVDSTPPNITITYPQNMTYNYSIFQPTLNWTVTGDYDSCWYQYIDEYPEDYALNEFNMYVNNRGTDSEEVWLGIDFDYNPSFNFTFTKLEFDKDTSSGTCDVSWEIYEWNGTSHVGNRLAYNDSYSWDTISQTLILTPEEVVTNATDFIAFIRPISSGCESLNDILLGRSNVFIGGYTRKYNSTSGIWYWSDNQALRIRVWQIREGLALLNTTMTCTDNSTSFDYLIGNNTISLFSNDSVGNTDSEIVLFDVFDDVPPNITSSSPANDSIHPEGNVNFSVGLTDEFGLGNATLYIYNESGLYNQTTVDLTGLVTTTTVIPVYLIEGDYTWSWNIIDGDDNPTLQGNQTLEVDATSPEISIVYPTNVSYKYNQAPTELNYTYTETNPDTCWYNINGTNQTITCGQNVTGLTSGNGSNTWYLYINDSAGNENFTSIIFFVSTPPSLNIVYPTNTTYNSQVTELNYTVSDSDLDSCWWTNGTANYSITCGQNVTTPSLEGSNTWIVYANDSAGNEVSDTVVFVSDFSNPQITISSPSNNSYVSGNSFTVTASGYDSAEDEIIFTLWNETAMNDVQLRNVSAFDQVFSGSYPPDSSDEKYFNDSNLGTYWNKTSGIGIVDVRFSNLSYQLLSDDISSGSFTTYYQVINNGGDGNLYLSGGSYYQCWNWSSNAWINFGSALTITSTGTHTVTRTGIHTDCINDDFRLDIRTPTYSTGANMDVHWFEAWVQYQSGNDVPMQQATYTDGTRSHQFTGLNTDGKYFFNVYMDDDYDRSNVTDTYTITIDNANPSGESGGFGGSGTSPSNNSAFNVPSVNLTVNASDDGGIKNITLVVENETGDIINETTIDIEGIYGYSPTEIFFGIVYYFVYEGWYNWYFKIADMVGNIFTTTEATMLYDITCPNCSIIYYPLNTSYADNITQFNYTLLEENPDTCWFSTDYGATNTTVTCSQNLTNLTSVEGTNFWWFWVNDTAGNEHQCNVTFNIDTVAPSIYVHSPLDSAVYNTTEILLNVTTSESFIWWSIDNGTTNTTYLTPTLISFIGGDNVLHVWANDSAGNLNLTIVYFNADVFAPLVDLYPINDTGTDSYPHYINITYVIVDDNPDVCWYTYGDNWSSDEFAYDKSSENITFTGDENVTRYLIVPNGTTLTNATLTLTGFDAEDVSSFENTTDGWTLCGGDAYINDSWSSRGDWNVRLDSHGGTHEIYKQVNLSEYDYLIFDYNRSAQNKSLKWGYCDNIASCDGVHSGCAYWGTEGLLDQNGVHLDNTVDISGVTGTKYLLVANLQQGVGGWYNYTQIDNIRLSSVNTTTHPTNAYLEIGNTDGDREWSLTEANESNTPVVVNGIADEINSYLETCSIVNDSCYVPFIFHSDTGGFIRYSNMFYANYDFISCNTTTEVQVFDEGDLTLTVCAEDLVNLTGCDSESFYNMFHLYEQDVDSNITVEGDVSIFNLTIDMTESDDTRAWVVFNGVSYEATDETIIGDIHIFEKQLTIPDGSGNLTGKNASWYWIYDIEGYTGNYSTGVENMTVYALEIDNCTNQSRVILNLTLKDEETVAILNPNVTSSIELELAIISTLNEDVQWLYEDTAEKNLVVCIPEGILNHSTYKIEFTIGFNALDYVQEFYYLDNGTLDLTDMFNSYTNHTIDLMDLLATDSTTFLFKFTNVDGLPVDDAIIHVFRKYIGEGRFREVERARQDDNGETHVHLVEEDVIYYFMVTQEGNIIYTSSTYNAKCLSTPCSIEFEADSELAEFDTDWDLIENMTYTVIPNKETRVVSLIFTSEEATTMNLTVYEYEEAVEGYEINIIDSESLTASTGTIQTSIPASYGDKIFYYAVYKEDELVKKDGFSFEKSGREIFGTFGVILTALLLLALILMTVTEGVPMVVFIILGLILAVVLKLMDMSWVAFIGITVAGLIIVVKLVNRRQVVER